jgi:hypothetical protein
MHAGVKRLICGKRRSFEKPNHCEGYGMSRSDWIAAFSAGLSLISAYSVVLTRQQDHEIDYLQGLEGKIYDQELVEPKLLCFYDDPFVKALDCSEDDRKANLKTAAYLSLAVDFSEAVKSYQQRWCWRVDVFLTNDCDLYAEFVEDVRRDPTGAFAAVKIDRPR